MSGLETGSFDPQGPAAAAMEGLWWLMFWLGLAVFTVFAALLGIGLFRGRATDPRDEEPASHGFTRGLVVIGVVVPALIILAVFVATIVAMRWVPTSASDDAMVVEVTGHQWRWEVTYPDEGVRATNELHIPVGRTINVQLTSSDVIHSFWVPELGGKMDALPDGVNTLVLRADQPGEHRTQCAEFCGLRHADMKLLVVAEPVERFESWISERQAATDGAETAVRAAAAAEAGRAR
ncbi:MAG TPA: cytochrome c oxidase subunit II [Euzebyales bacterium]|nr:cytochrome c oxidase subunit II [Euzebyales bacterium]